MIPLDADHVPDLIADLEAAARDFATRFEADATLWDRGSAGKWSAGQHADHVAFALGQFADAIQARARAWDAGARPARPRRWPLQSFMVRMLTGPVFPRGGRSSAAIQPAPHPERGATLARLSVEAARYRGLADRLSPQALADLWFPNPLVPRWHYRIPEALRVQASHVRHHGKLIDEIARK